MKGMVVLQQKKNENNLQSIIASGLILRIIWVAMLFVPIAEAKQIFQKRSVKYAAESYHLLLKYAEEANIKVLIENHGGVSNDADFMIALMKEVNHPLFGAYPDWREPADDFDNYTYLQKTLPYAKGMSYRNQPTEELTAKMIELCKQSGYHGWYGIESNGRDAIKQGNALLNRYLFNE